VAIRVFPSVVGGSASVDSATPQKPAADPPPAAAPGAPQKPHAKGWDGKSKFDPSSQGSATAGAVAGSAGVRAPVQAQTRAKTQQFYREVSHARRAAEAQIDAVRAEREGVSHRLDEVQHQLSALQEQKPNPVKAGDPWVQQFDELVRQKKALESSKGALLNKIQRLQRKPLEVEGARLPPGKVGPVAAVVVDNQTGQAYRAVNGDGTPSPLAKVLQEQLARIPPGAHPSTPGSHAEIQALNQAILAREARTGRPVTAAELSTFTLDTAWLEGDAGKTHGMAAGAPAERCAHCAHGTRGVDDLVGDSPRPYDSGTGRVTSWRWAAHERAAARGGAGAGAAVGLLYGVADAVHTGHFDAKKVATATAVGVGTGAVGGLVQEVGARGFDRAAGEVVERGVNAMSRRLVSTEVADGLAATTRQLAGRMAGAGIAGAVINAGFATVDQIRAYRQGKVTASQAIGTVTGEAAVGLGAGLAGAAAGAAIGSVIPIAGTAVGAVVGFAVGVAAGYLADKGLRALGVDKAIAHVVTGAIDEGSKLVHDAGHVLSNVSHSLFHALGW
jgi:hypothetical protein